MTQRDRVRKLPGGTVTLVFTDIEGSTRLLHTLGPGYEDALATHRRLLREAFLVHCGIEVDTQGDAFFYAFSRAHDALAGAIQGQRALASHPWPGGAELRVRMGIHTGEPTVTQEGYVGSDVHLGARICAAAWGEQILVSDPTALLAQLPDLSLRDLGEHSLKDIDHPLRLHQVLAAGLRQAFPPLRTASSHPTNLPPKLSPLLGRTEDITELVSLLAAPDSRIVTLTGPGGVGKTRVALAAGAEMLRSFEDGVFFVDLSALADPALVVGAIAAALGLRESPGRTVAETVADYLASRNTLLILDNLEHLLGAVAEVSALVSSASSLKVLVTSREPLRIEGEMEFPLSPLALPLSGDEPEDILASSAVELFVTRAQAVRPAFIVSPEAAPYVAQICRRLDGLPLAIELAAARVKVLSVAALASRLEDSLAALGSGRRDASDRQRTLKGAIAWSYELLEDDEQRLFARLGVFAGGWTLEAAEAVCDRDDLSFDVLQGLSSLVDKSLVRQVEGDEERFSMLETIRSFATDKLRQSPEADEIRRAHAHYFRELAEEAAPHLVGARQKEWLDRLERDHDNLRTALEWALTEGSPLALEIAAALWRFWDIRGYVTEARRWLADTLSHPFDNFLTRATVMRAAGSLAEAQGSYDEARRLIDSALEIYRSHDDERNVVLCLIELAVIARMQGALENARAFSEQAVKSARHANDGWALARALVSLGEEAVEASNVVEARALYQEALALEREVQDKRGILLVTNNLGELELHSGDPQQASRYLQEAVSLAEETGDVTGRASALGNFGLVALLEENAAKAEGHFVSALQIGTRVGSPYLVAGCLEGLSIAVMMGGRLYAGACLFGAAQRARQEGGLHDVPSERSLYEVHIAAAMTALGPERWLEGVTQGGAMTADEAARVALMEDVKNDPPTKRL
jgi:predicted ATPase/class 3 adenylate cyclase/Tfp pilus assembly protein PilF